MWWAGYNGHFNYCMLSSPLVHICLLSGMRQWCCVSMDRLTQILWIYRNLSKFLSKLIALCYFVFCFEDMKCKVTLFFFWGVDSLNFYCLWSYKVAFLFVWGVTRLHFCYLRIYKWHIWCLGSYKVAFLLFEELQGTIFIVLGIAWTVFLFSCWKLEVLILLEVARIYSLTH